MTVKQRRHSHLNSPCPERIAPMNPFMRSLPEFLRDFALSCTDGLVVQLVARGQTSQIKPKIAGASGVILNAGRGIFMERCLAPLHKQAPAALFRFVKSDYQE